ncbi:hypothetical protein X798_05581 [Onchocerca flexuosa]|uniref:PRELI/MSF1 domain-containing protein n=2 Tax=Onchocerca flexuosa TaxID=387005 RepID=A0A183HY31_9BILA|nr:hypothetical protein X798_05581 [Onchocerca flexuosa]VDP11223.1 unnamed protein product [Onchocerca flexuosa]
MGEYKWGYPLTALNDTLNNGMVTESILYYQTKPIGFNATQQVQERFDRKASQYVCFCSSWCSRDLQDKWIGGRAK